MKHTLPLLALVAAASAQTAPASGLNYNQLTVSRHQRQNTVAAQTTLKDSNILVGISTTSGNETDNTVGQINLGYIFKNVTNGVDATVSIIQTNSEASVYSVVLRRQWNEVYQGLEISAGYAGTLASNSSSDFVLAGTGLDNAQSATFVELAYNYNKTFALAVGLVKPASTANYSDRATVFSVRAGF
jgi:hypothetical protein